MGKEPGSDRSHVGLRATLDVGELRDVLVVGEVPEEVLIGPIPQRRTGLLTDRQATEKGVGGEVIAYVW